MTKEEFDKIFNQSLDRTKVFWDKDQVHKRLKDFLGSDSIALSPNDAMTYARLEAQEYTNQFVYNVLHDLLVKDLKDPKD